MSAEILTKTDGISHEEWLKQRRRGIGGSDAPTILGLNKWKSSVQLYMEKLGEVKNYVSTEATYWGTVLEDVVAREFALRSGKKIRNRNAILRHPKYEWMLANVDRLIIGEKAGLECKTASEYLKDEWVDDQVPASYIVQCQHYMAVTGYKEWWIAVLIGGNKYQFKKIERDDELINMIIEAEKDFWENHIVPKIPPEIDGSEASERLLNTLYPLSEPDSEMDLSNEADQMIKALEQVKIEINDLSTLKKEYENKLKKMIGDHEKAYASHHIVTWKSYVTNRIDTKLLKAEKPEIYEQYVKPSSARRFMIKEAK